MDPFHFDLDPDTFVIFLFVLPVGKVFKILQKYKKCTVELYRQLILLIYFFYLYIIPMLSNLKAKLLVSHDFCYLLGAGSAFFKWIQIRRNHQHLLKNTYSFKRDYKFRQIKNSDGDLLVILNTFILNTFCSP